MTEQEKIADQIFGSEDRLDIGVFYHKCVEIFNENNVHVNKDQNFDQTAANKFLLGIIKKYQFQWARDEKNNNLVLRTPLTDLEVVKPKGPWSILKTELKATLKPKIALPRLGDLSASIIALVVCLYFVEDWADFVIQMSRDAIKTNAYAGFAILASPAAVSWVLVRLYDVLIMKKIRDLKGR